MSINQFDCYILFSISLSLSFLWIKLAASNIPSHNIQSHIYQPSQPFVQNYVPHMSPSGNLFQVPHYPGVYFSNFTASVNVHGYTQTVQPQYMPPNFVQNDNHQSSVDQVSVCCVKWSTHSATIQCNYRIN